MDQNRLFGGNPVGVLIRLLLLSLVVGIVLSALGITPANFFHHVEIFVRRLYELGSGAIEAILQYVLIGAMVVVPIWLIARLFGVLSRRSEDRRPRMADEQKRPE
jgi:hypothetical protein